MNIPATSSAAWAIVGIRQEEKPPLTVLPEGIRQFMAAVEQAFNIPCGTLSRKNFETGRPYRFYNDVNNKVNLSHIRKAIILRLNNETVNYTSRFGMLINLDRTTAYKLLIDAKGYFDTGHEDFISVYEKVKQVPLTV